MLLIGRNDLALCFEVDIPERGGGIPFDLPCNKNSYTAGHACDSESLTLVTYFCVSPSE